MNLLVMHESACSAAARLCESAHDARTCWCCANRPVIREPITALRTCRSSANLLLRIPWYCANLPLQRHSPATSTCASLMCKPAVRACCVNLLCEPAAQTCCSDLLREPAARSCCASLLWSKRFCKNPPQEPAAKTRRRCENLLLLREPPPSPPCTNGNW